MNKLFYQFTKEFAVDADKFDDLKDFRNEFNIPVHNGKEILYFTGNSLGLQPKKAREYILQELEDWSKFGVEGHFNAKNPWLNYHEYLSDYTAQITGALPSEVVIMNSLTVNIHLLMVSFYQPDSKKKKILIEPSSFPSDYYALESQAKFHGYEPKDVIIEVPLRKGEVLLHTEDILSLIEKEGDSIALLWFGNPNYYTGQAYDIPAITKAAHKKGIKVGLDLAHGAGNLLLKLHDWNVDFAAWCSYKYLNGGPGAVAGIYVHERYHKRELPMFAGWWGHNKSTRFLMNHNFMPMQTAEKWQLSNPPIFQMAALRASLEIFHKAGMENLRTKSIKLTSYLEFLINNELSSYIEIITPKDINQRGCQLSLKFNDNGRDIFCKLSGEGISCDWREPDVIRCAPVPLYNKYTDVYGFVEILKKLV